MSHVCSVWFIITAIAIIIYDYKYQSIPFSIVILNYLCISILTDPILAIGFIGLCICKKLDRPVDIVYIMSIGLFALYYHNENNICCILPILIQVFTSENHKKISLMISLEMAWSILLYLHIWYSLYFI